MGGCCDKDKKEDGEIVDEDLVTDQVIKETILPLGKAIKPKSEKEVMAKIENHLMSKKSTMGKNLEVNYLKENSCSNQKFKVESSLSYLDSSSDDEVYIPVSKMEIPDDVENKSDMNNGNKNQKNNPSVESNTIERDKQGAKTRNDQKAKSSQKKNNSKPKNERAKLGAKNNIYGIPGYTTSVDLGSYQVIPGSFGGHQIGSSGISFKPSQIGLNSRYHNLERNHTTNFSNLDNDFPQTGLLGKINKNGLLHADTLLNQWKMPSGFDTTNKFGF
ncbi:unnamed protein product [Moneuplotes crassus]|uniref:Uncharacterized protein n=1 Tax=Euplotes crassus TaxID=5936 RepID=A0AAD1UT24_EUPCR|nr:unnamed protein product [Moneuplotes crassus]